MSIFIYEDPDDNITYEMNYIITQSDDEGPEYVEWRISPRMAGSESMDTTWHRLPPWATPPEEAIEFWHGTVSKVDAKTNNDLNDLAGALYRLTVDLKRLGVIPATFHFSS
jgi:hypothetical protein